MSIRRMLRVASIMLGSLGVRDLSAAPLGELGERLDQAQKTEFFRWFHLEEAGRQGLVVQFKPSGEKFRSLVTLNLTLDAGQRMVGAELILSRSFVDSGRDGMFARDIAKSFLRMVTAEGERKGIAGLLAEIEQAPANLSGTLIVREGVTPRVTSAPSPGYWTFIGEQKSYEQRVGGGRIRLENREADSTQVLAIARW